MPDKVDYVAKFGEHFGAYKGAKGTVENLSSTDIKRKVLGRNTIRKKEKLAPHIKVSDANLEKLALGYEGIATDRLYGFFEDNREAVLNGLPANTLESKFLDIAPVEVEGNNKHNEVAQMHVSYLNTRNLNKAYDEKKINFGAYAAPLSQLAAQQTVQELSQDEHLKESTIMLMAEARAELIGESEILARDMGGRLESQAKKAVVGRIEEMAGAAKVADRYTKAEYARNNLIHNNNNDYVIDMAGQCLPKPKK